MKYVQANLNPAVRRYIKQQELQLGRKCRMIWSFTNPKNETFLFGSFCRNYNQLIVTIAIHSPIVCGGWLPVNL